MDAPPEVVAYVEEATCFAGPLGATIASVLYNVSTASGVGWLHVVGRKRSPVLDRARKAVAFGLRAIDAGEGRHLSSTEIGLVLGGREHTSVLYLLGTLGRQKVGVVS